MLEYYYFGCFLQMQADSIFFLLPLASSKLGVCGPCLVIGRNHVCKGNTTMQLHVQISSMMFTCDIHYFIPNEIRIKNDFSIVYSLCSNYK
jgi:hypothetical protein